MSANPFWGTPAGTRKRRNCPEAGGKEWTSRNDKALIFQGFSDFSGCLRHIKFDLMVEVSGIEKLPADLCHQRVSSITNPIGYDLGYMIYDLMLSSNISL